MRRFVSVLLLSFALGGCGNSTFQQADEQIKASWSEVLSQYQRRADLVPNLVNTVKGEAGFEQSTLTDTTGTLAREQVAALEQRPAAFDARKGVQIAVATVPTTRPEPIELYALRVAEQWKLGRGKVDDGASLVIAKDDRALRIERWATGSRAYCPRPGKGRPAAAPPVAGDP